MTAIVILALVFGALIVADLVQLAREERARDDFWRTYDD